MIEMTIHGRGGQGGVTLAKLIATSYFLRGGFTQAFGVYAAERSGAPLAAFVRIDSEEILNHNQVRTPDHVIVLDRTLIGPNIAFGMKEGGWIILNAPEPPEAFAKQFGGRRVAAIDATSLALVHSLGTKSVPIVNTAMLGAVLKVLGEPWEAAAAALSDLKFGGANVEVAREAFDKVRRVLLTGKPHAAAPPAERPPPLDILDERIGAPSPIRTGSWATRSPHRRQMLSPCSNACPAGNDIQGFVRALNESDPDEALAILLESSPLPGVCGRVCPAPCMNACNRTLFDEPVQIRELERFAAEHGRRPDAIQPGRDERIAVVGSGPAGLSAAYHLARLGYRVTIYEGGSELGGLLRTGIPAYRLPPDVLDRDIDFILSHGVTVERDRYVDRAQLLDLSHRYNAVFVGTGLQQVRSMDLGAADGDRVLEGIDFLDRVRHGDLSLAGERVIVIGGGNTAIDAARSALRAGAKKVRILYRRSRAQMPAIAEEITEALEEGVVIEELVAPLHVRRGPRVPDGEQAETLLTCVRMRLGPRDAGGRMTAVEMVTEDSRFDVACDRVILALGQGSDLSILPEGAEIRDRDHLLGLSGAPIYLGGDFATNDGTVAAAIGSGRRAAWQIHKTLTGENLRPAELPRVAGYEHMHMHVFTQAPARHAAHRDARQRRRTFEEVRLGLAESEGPAEAGRCLSCGVCNECDRCVTHCPEGILRRDGDGYRFDYDYCKGCGICAAQCPRGVIYMAEL
ncbi:MAG: hypothetical protein DCC65_09540 [Planctomycetota bacterium]|nr:MAG: hypothetical protein DCC65_09540 [Planctomycetota bacterium]